MASENTLVVTPLALLIAENIQEGDSIEKVVVNLRLREEEARKALNELTNTNTYLIIVRDGKLTCDKTKVYIEANILRWNIWDKDAGP